MDITNLLQKKSGICLDIGCGGAKQRGFVGMDVRALPGVDIVWNVLKFPWPLPDECVLTAMSSHLLEHIPPFGADPKLLGLVELLVTKNVISPSEVKKFIGTADSTPMFIAFMDEVWRVMKPEGKFIVSVPYGRSDGYLQDPTHCNQMNEARWLYFDPLYPSNPVGLLWSIYTPKPWKILNLVWDPATNMEVVLEKRAEESCAI